MFNASDYGDSPDAIQRCIDACLGDADPKLRPRDARGPIYLPAGDYYITEPLQIHSAQHVNFYGDGGSTRLIPVGKMGSVLDINGCAHSTFRDFRIEGNGRDEAVADAIACYYDPATAYRSTTRVTFDHVIVANTRCVTAIRSGKPGTGTQCDQIAYRDLTLTGAWKPGETDWYQHGLYVGDGIFGNNLIHSAYNLSSSFWGNGVTADATNFGLWGGCFGQNGTDLNAQTLAYFTAQGFRSESSQRLFQSIGPSSHVALYNLSDIVWSADRLAPDGEFVRMRTNGNLSVRNLQVVNGGSNARISASPPIAGSVRLQGVASQCSLGSLLKLTSTATAVVDGFSCYDDRIGQKEASSGLVLNKGSIDFGDGRKWTPQGLFVAKDRYWSDDGLFPGIGVKWEGAGGLIGRKNGDLDWVDWVDRNNGTVVKSNRGRK